MPINCPTKLDNSTTSNPFRKEGALSATTLNYDYTHMWVAPLSQRTRDGSRSRMSEMTLKLQAHPRGEPGRPQ